MNQGEVNCWCRVSHVLWKIMCDRLEQNPSESMAVFQLF